jgi:ribonuclease PH
VTNLEIFGERTVWVDCDVIQGDGGTRCASIVGGYVSLVEALDWLRRQGKCEVLPVTGFVAAVSVGIVHHQPVLDLDYEEDRDALVDMNVVMTDDGRLVEVQGTAEGEPFDRDQMQVLMDLAEKGINDIVAEQRAVLQGLVGEST